MSKPTRATWFMTHRCNIACSYCATILPEQVTDELDLEGTLDIAEALAAIGPEIVILTGGEALMHPHVQPVIDLFNRVGQEFVVITNATRPLTVTGIKNISCSIDTTDVPHRARRADSGSDELYKSSWGWELLTTAADRGMVPTASIVAGRSNAYQVPALIEELAAQGITSMVGTLHQSPLQIGVHWRFRSQGDDATLLPEQAEWLSSALCALKDRGVPILNDRSYFVDMARHGAALDWHCDTPSDLMVDSDGSIMTCQDWWGAECKALNVRDAVLGPLWQRVRAIDQWCEDWTVAHRVDNAKCSGCFWNCTHQAASDASSVSVGLRALR